MAQCGRSYRDAVEKSSSRWLPHDDNGQTPVFQFPFKWPWKIPQQQECRSQQTIEPIIKESEMMLAVTHFFDVVLWADSSVTATDQLQSISGISMQTASDSIDPAIEHLGADVLQPSTDGPRISYSTTTAEWMAAVAVTPADEPLVCGYLGRSDACSVV